MKTEELNPRFRKLKNSIFTLTCFVQKEAPECQETVTLLEQAANLITDALCALKDEKNTLEESSQNDN